MKSRTLSSSVSCFLLLFLAYFALSTVVEAQENRPAPTQAPAVSPAPAATLDSTPPSQGSPQVAQPIATPAAPKVIKVEGNLELDDIVRVQVENFTEWAETNDATKLVPFLNGRAIRGNYPEEIHPDHDRLHFHLEMTPENKEVWTDLLGEPDGTRRPVTFSVGLESQSPFDTVHNQNNPVLLTVISKVYGVIALVVVLFTLILFLWLARKTNIIREPGPTPGAGKLRPYNLGRTQMAFWFFLIYCSYTAIWLITGSLDTITASLLGLMGISAGTALGEALIDSGKDEAREAQLQSLLAEKQSQEQSIPDLQAQLSAVTSKATPTLEDTTSRDSLNKQLQDSRTRLAQISQQIQTLTPADSRASSTGFLHDILADSSGYSFHRFQIFAWTIILGIIFVSAVYNNLNMPEFSPTLLGLMGLSSGTYIGFKFPEQK